VPVCCYFVGHLVSRSSLYLCCAWNQDGRIVPWKAAPAFIYYALRPSVASERCSSLLQKADVDFIKTVWRLLDSCACGALKVIGSACVMGGEGRGHRSVACVCRFVQNPLASPPAPYDNEGSAGGGCFVPRVCIVLPPWGLLCYQTRCCSSRYT